MTTRKYLIPGLFLCWSALLSLETQAQQLVTGSVLGSREPADVTRFCSNVIDEARERRYALKEQELQALMKDVESRIAVLEEKRAAYVEWMRRREDFASQATESIVDIYAKMRPDAAAQRMEILQADLAAAILLKLPSRNAGIILNEMSAKSAAVITSIIADAARPTDPS
ncbi:MAG: MotE family protein [Notoacmeibacter sp.]|nr:MotE family protein [Notoacmeibacter sp.]